MSMFRGAGTRSTLPGIILGVGLGAFVDGIVFHQILQWHNMGSARVPPVTLQAMQQNMMWDGFFHAAVLIATVVGVFLFRRDARRGTILPNTRMLIGQLMLGWGWFNLVEGIVDHLLLQLHHVRDLPTHMPLYDWVFLLVGGILFIAMGLALARPTSTATRTFRVYRTERRIKDRRTESRVPLM